MWLNVGPTNNNPQVVALHYLNTLLELKTVPLNDHKSVAGLLQTFFRNISEAAMLSVPVVNEVTVMEPCLDASMRYNSKSQILMTDLSLDSKMFCDLIPPCMMLLWCKYHRPLKLNRNPF